jgi:hypothetical protein
VVGQIGLYLAHLTAPTLCRTAAAHLNIRRHDLSSK